MAFSIKRARAKQGLHSALKGVYARFLFCMCRKGK